MVFTWQASVAEVTTPDGYPVSIGCWLILKLVMIGVRHNTLARLAAQSLSGPFTRDAQLAAESVGA